MLLVSGDVARRTGGNLYDRRVERACRRAGIRFRIISVGSIAEARSALARTRPRVVVIDSIAIPIAAPLVNWTRAELDARVVSLMHMPTAARGTRRVLRAADRVVAVSDDLGRALVRAGVPRSRLTVIPPGSDGVRRIPRRKRPDGGLRVLAVANWSAAKGIATLVAAAARVPEVRLDLVGDTGAGATREAVLERIATSGLQDRVVVHGALSGRALARRYAEADVFALPTAREGYGTVFAEAISHGLPIIAPDIAAVRSLVGDAALIVPAGRVRPLASALRLMTDGWIRRRLARAARSRARVLPTWTASETAFVALVEDEMRAAKTRT